MTTALSTTVLTIVDWSKRLDPNGKVPVIAELLSQTNEVLTDFLLKEGNLPVGEMVTIRTGLPTVYWRLLNQGTATSKSLTAQVTEQTGILDAWAEADQILAELNGNVRAFRLSEARAFLEAMNQEMAGTIFYGNSGLAPEEFTGLSPRYSAISGATNAQNVISAGGVGSDNSSIWLVVWGENTIYGIFPKGSKAGLSHEDLGLVTVEVTAGVGGTRMRAYQDHWTWRLGLVVKDWRYAVRICNIDISNLRDKSSAADLFDLMIRSIHRIPALGMGKPVFYMNRSTHQYLEIQGRDDVVSGGGLTFENGCG